MLHRLLGTATFLLILHFPAQAASPGSGSVDDLLDSIPDIQVAEDEKAAPPPVEVLSLPEYVAQCRSTILDRWVPSEKLVRKKPGLVTEMLIKIDAEGKISGISIIESSGNKKFDKSAYAAVAGDFQVDPPPRGIRSNVGSGVVVTFAARNR